MNEYAIEELEQYLRGLKEDFRSYRNLYSAIGIKESKAKIEDVQQAIKILKTYEN